MCTISSQWISVIGPGSFACWSCLSKWENIILVNRKQCNDLLPLSQLSIVSTEYPFVLISYKQWPSAWSFYCFPWELAFAISVFITPRYIPQRRWRNTVKCIWIWVLNPKSTKGALELKPPSVGNYIMLLRHDHIPSWI